MKWNNDILTKIDFKNITNLEEKKQVASKITDKVKDGQVIRIWLWFYIIFSYINHSRENKEGKNKYYGYSYFNRNKNALQLFRNNYNDTK